MQAEKTAHLTGHQGAVYALEKGKDEKHFFSGGGDGWVIEWNIEDATRPKVIAKVPAVNIFSLCYLADANILLVGQMQGGVHVLDLSLKKESKLLQVHKGAVFAVKQRNAQVLTAGGDGVLGFLDEDFKIKKLLKISNKSLRSIDINPFRPEAAIGCSDNNIYIVDISTHEVIQKVKAHKNSVFSVKYHPSGKFLFSGSRDAHLNIFDIKDYSLHHSVPAHLFTINAIEVNPRSGLFATGSRDKSARIWHLDDFKLLKSLDKEKNNGHINSVNALLWLTDEYLISGSDDRSVIIWKIKV